MIEEDSRRRTTVYKAIGIWSWPRDEDRAEFDEHYEQVHYPLAEKLPGVRRITVLTGGENARASGMFRVAEVYWDDRDAFDRAAASAEWQAMAADAQQLIERYGVTLLAADGEETDRQY
jgi:uncharacterized protein (TIGR02118 family)